MKIKMLLMAVVLIGLLFSLSASAILTNEECDNVPIQELTYTTTAEIPKFDQTLGDLKSVKLTAWACGYLNREISSEDLSPDGIDYTVVVVGQVKPTIPNIGEQIFQISANEEFHLATDDEPGLPPDWAGPDYKKIEIGSPSAPECTPTKEYTFNTDVQMAPFKGNAGEKVQIPVKTSSSNTVIGSNEYYSRGSTSMGFDICVVYEYEIPPRCINGTKTNACTGEGLAGWTINLKDASGNVIATRTTDANGDYSFCGLLPGSYTVCEVTQDGWKAVEPTCIPVTLEDVNVEGVDFENKPPFCINGSKINDCNDEGLAGWTINLLDADGNVIDTELTGSDGSYSFCGLIPGTYSVEEVLQAGWQAVSGPTNPIVLDCSNSENNDFVNAPLLCINGTKINDCNDEGLAGWTINLLDADGNVVDTELTGSDGSYSFCGLIPGTYSVEEVLQAGWQAVTGPTNPIVLDCSNSENNDFVNAPLLCINGSKINDCNDEGLAGWTINLLDADGNVVDTELTGSDGSYSFCGLIPGTYSVEEVLQAGWQAVTGPTNPIVLDCSNSENNDFVNAPLLCINGTKINDCTDEGLAGWTINLLDADGNVVDTELTGSDGSYSFCGLIPGTYSVEEVLQAGWQAVTGPTNPIVLDCSNSENNDFVNAPLLCINGTKINSVDGTGLAGWTIKLYSAFGLEMGTTTTDANGDYSFCSLASGTYTVCEVLQDGWTNVTPTCINVPLDCEDSTDNDFENQPEAQEVCETAWAFLDGWECFTKTGNWGSLTEITPGESLTLTGDVWAGRAKCDQTKGWLVGTATITVSADGYKLDLDLNGDCHVEDLHVWVNNAKPDVKGGFSDKRWYKFESMDGLKLDLTKPIWVAVHTETCCSACDNGCTYPAP